MREAETEAETAVRLAVWAAVNRVGRSRSFSQIGASLVCQPVLREIVLSQPRLWVSESDQIREFYPTHTL